MKARVVGQRRIINEKARVTMEELEEHQSRESFAAARTQSAYPVREAHSSLETGERESDDGVTSKGHAVVVRSEFLRLFSFSR